MENDEKALLFHINVILKKWIKEQKVGNVSINFFKGGVSSIKLEETIKLPKQE